jgi:hypothetical protein
MKKSAKALWEHKYLPTSQAKGNKKDLGSIGALEL